MIKPMRILRAISRGIPLHGTGLVDCAKHEFSIPVLILKTPAGEAHVLRVKIRGSACFSNPPFADHWDQVDRSPRFGTSGSRNQPSPVQSSRCICTTSNRAPLHSAFCLLPATQHRLFLLALRLLRLGLGPLLPHADESRLAPDLPELLVRAALDVLRHLALFDLREAVLEAEAGVDGQDGGEALDAVLVRALDVVLAAVEVFVLAGAAGEEDQARAVGLEAGDVEGERLFGQVLAARVEGDADCGGQFAGDAGFLRSCTQKSEGNASFWIA